ncbi:I12R1 protein, partial [Burhinus bistriatus]|nr:I12R1 protein [Burhinus bistriatus]
LLSYTKPKLCQRFEAGAETTYTLNHHHVYVLTNATAWVEARWGDHIHRTPNLTLYLNEAVKLDPPPTGMPFTKTGGRLQLRVPWPPCHRRGRPPQWEARFQRKGDRGWTQVKTLFAGAGGDRWDVTCTLGAEGTFEVQLRHKLPHWSSYWSDWSSSIFVPEEILASLELSYQLGKLGRDGQRVLRLGWQQAPKEQGNVTYTLRARMLACRCTEPAEEDTVVLGMEVTTHNLTLSGAEYEILLTAANAAGPGPVRQLRVPAEQHADLSFKDVSMAGSTVTARWEAPSPGFAYCFEQQPLPGALKQGVCIQRDFPAKSIHVERGKGAPRASRPSPLPGARSWQPGALEMPACYRLAVHGWAPARGWSTFALQHHYASNASLAVPIHINASARDAAIILQWTPSRRAACPGALAKYLICHAAEGDNVTYAEADAAASHFTLQNLRPSTTYRVGVWEVTAESGGTCSAWWHFQIKALGNGWRPSWKSNLKYLGILLSLPAVATVYQLSKKRAHRLLFPPLPKPVGSKAIQFSTGEMSQGQPQPGFVEPSERFSPAELLITELNPGKEMADTGTRPGTPHPNPVAKEPVVVCPSGCEKELPFAYRRQEVLSPVGFPLSGSTGCSGHPPSKEEEEEEEEEEEGRWGLRQPLVPIALLISDKPVIIRDEEGWDPSPEKSVP